MGREEFPNFGIPESCLELVEQREEFQESMKEKMIELQDRYQEAKEKGQDTEQIEKQLLALQSEYNQKMEEFEQKHLKRSMMETQEPHHTEDIEHIRKNVSEHLAEKLTRKDQRYRKNKLEYLTNKLDYEERHNESYFRDPPMESELGGLHIGTEIALAKEGVVLEDLFEGNMDYGGMLESGAEYVIAKERLEKVLGKVSFEVADNILENGNKEGKYTPEHYQNLKLLLRRYYGK